MVGIRSGEVSRSSPVYAGIIGVDASSVDSEGNRPRRIRAERMSALGRRNTRYGDEQHLVISANRDGGVVQNLPAHLRMHIGPVRLERCRVGRNRKSLVDVADLQRGIHARKRLYGHVDAGAGIAFKAGCGTDTV